MNQQQSGFPASTHAIYDGTYSSTPTTPNSAFSISFGQGQSGANHQPQQIASFNQPQQHQYAQYGQFSVQNPEGVYTYTTPFYQGQGISTPQHYSGMGGTSPSGQNRFGTSFKEQAMNSLRLLISQM